MGKWKITLVYEIEASGPTEVAHRAEQLKVLTGADDWYIEETEEGQN